MNKKGFTLVELLAVIVLLGIVITLAATKGFGVFDTAKDKISKQNENAIKEAARVYMTDVQYCNDDLNEVLDLRKVVNSTAANCSNLKNYFQTTTRCLKLSQLIENNYISGNDITDISSKNPSLCVNVKLEITTNSTNIKINEIKNYTNKS